MKQTKSKKQTYLSFLLGRTRARLPHAEVEQLASYQCFGLFHTIRGGRCSGRTTSSGVDTRHDTHSKQRRAYAQP